MALTVDDPNVISRGFPGLADPVRLGAQAGFLLRACNIGDVDIERHGNGALRQGEMPLFFGNEGMKK